MGRNSSERTLQNTEASPKLFLTRLLINPGPRDSPSLAGAVHWEPRAYLPRTRSSTGTTPPRSRTRPQAREPDPRGPHLPLEIRTRSLIRKILGECSVRKVRLERLRPLLDLLDPVKHPDAPDCRMCGKETVPDCRNVRSELLGPIS